MNRLGVQAAALIISLSLFLLSCEKDALGHGSGEKVTINFTVSNGDYDADQQITRSEKRRDLKAETVHTPLNDDYFLAATLTPEPEEELRDVAAFANNQKIYFAAYLGTGTTPVDAAFYTWDGSRFVPDDKQLKVEADGTTYHFVAYSFFGDPEEEPYVAGIEPFQDFVWGEKDQQIFTDETSRTVPILMKHKFSRVRVQVDASTIDAQVTAVSGVVIAGGKEATITPKTGTIASYGDAVTETLGNWTSENGGKARCSEYKVFCPQLTTVTLEEIDLEIDANPLQVTNKSVTFSQTLLANTSYTVIVSVMENRWAHSNIYWESSLNGGAGGLMFDKKRTNPSHADYQGVFFKWGSLVGISPVGSVDIDGKGDVVLYIPANITSRTWDATKTLNSTDTPWEEAGIKKVPYLISPASGGDASNYLYNLSTVATYTAFTGDICRYLGGDDWQMPNSRVDLAQTFSSGFVSGFPFEKGSDPSDASGKGLMGSTVGATYTAWGFAFFPASGDRNELGGVEGVGQWGEYFVGNMADIVNCFPRFKLEYSDTNIREGISSSSRASTIRCIKKLPTD
jgi:hypothetical protein